MQLAEKLLSSGADINDINKVSTTVCHPCLQQVYTILTTRIIVNAWACEAQN